VSQHGLARVVHNIWINLACLLAVGVLNWLIVAKPVEVYRWVEIRPDCMIIEGADIFGCASRKMVGPPSVRTMRETISSTGV
jgi:hypothetical protein